MEKIIHFSVPVSKSKLQKACIARAQKMCPDSRIMIWEDDDLTNSEFFADYNNKVNSGAQIADLLRLEKVYLHGGIYLDSDMKVIKDLAPLFSLDNLFCSEDGHVITNAAFGASKHSPIIKKLIDDLLSNEPDWTLKPNVTTGPEFFTKLLSEDNITLLPRATFYPYNWDEAPYNYDKDGVYCEHLWSGSWLTLKDKLKIKKQYLKELFTQKKQKPEVRSGDFIITDSSYDVGPFGRVISPQEHDTINQLKALGLRLTKV